MSRLMAPTPRLAVLLVLVAGFLPEEAAAAEGWTFSAALRETYTDNLLLASPDDPGDSITTLNASLNYGRATERYGLSVGGSAGGSLFAELEHLSGAQLSASASGSYRPIRSASLRANASYAHGLNIDRTLGTGVLLPQVDVSVGQAGVGTTVAFSTRTSAGVDLGASWLGLRADLQLDGAQLALARSPFAVQPTPSTAAPPALPDPEAWILALLLSEGIELGRLDARTVNAGVNLSHAFSDRTTASMSVGVDNVDFDAPTLRDGGGLFGRVSLRRQMGDRTTLGLSFSEQRNDAQQPGVATRSATLDGQRRLGAHVQLQGSVGASVIDPEGPTPAERAWVGGFGISGSGRRTSWGASYDRVVHTARGFGRNQMSDSVTLHASRRMARRLTLSAYASGRFGAGVLGDEFRFDTQIASVSLGWQFWRRFGGSADYAFRRLARQGVPTIHSSQLTVGLTYARAWR